MCEGAEVGDQTRTDRDVRSWGSSSYVLTLPLGGSTVLYGCKRKLMIIYILKFGKLADVLTILLYIQ